MSMSWRRRLEDRGTERCVDLSASPSRSIKVILGSARVRCIKPQTRRQIFGEHRSREPAADQPTAHPCSREATPHALRLPGLRMDAVGAAIRCAASTITASLTGLASARSARIRAPSKSSCHTAVPAESPGTAAPARTLRSSRTSALPPTENATSGERPPHRCRLRRPDLGDSAGPPSGSSI